MQPCTRVMCGSCHSCLCRFGLFGSCCSCVCRSGDYFCAFACRLARAFALPMICDVWQFGLLKAVPIITAQPFGKLTYQSRPHVEPVRFRRFAMGSDGVAFSIYSCPFLLHQSLNTDDWGCIAKCLADRSSPKEDRSVDYPA